MFSINNVTRSGNYDAVVTKYKGKPSVYVSLDGIIEVMDALGCKHDLHNIRAEVLKEYIIYLESI